jgi:carbamoyl-phosphate synthase large subunit
MATSLPRRFALSAIRPVSRTLLSPSSANSSRALSSLSRLLPRAQNNNGAAKTLSGNSARWAAIQQARTFTSSKKLFENAPSSKAYLASGVIAGGRDLVDVSKVLVIGSGGLSIGQAGEFDYSGMTLCSHLPGLNC